MNRVRYRSGFRFPFFLCVLTALCTGACNTWALEALAPIRFESIAGLLLPAQTQITRGHGIVPYGGGNSSISAVCHLTYYGGPLVSNVQVVPVIWGSSVNAQITSNIAQFYTDTTVSTWYDFLSEYASVGGTNQSIGRGSSMAAVTITPSICATSAGCTMTDAQLQNELVAQINAGHLPAPQLDGAGYANTAYMVHFPPNISLRDPANNPSCAAGGFCSYHGTGLFGAGNTPFPYAAVMDTFTGGCSSGCGTSAFPLNNETSSSSHQLAELVTDTDVGLATTFAAPLAWYSSASGCGEIADICSQQQATITVSGRMWTVQKQWSNAQGACVATGTPPNYAVSAPATTPAGTAFSFGVTARNPYTNSTDIAYVGTVHFTSSDPGAVLPADFTFVPQDAGTGSFSATMMTQGSQTITATDTMNYLIVGTSASISVTTAADGTTLTTACPTTFVENQSIALMATVSNGVNPTGSVTFADGPTMFCSGVALASGSASCQTAALMVQGGGTSYVYNPIASYSGDGANTPSASSSLPLTILAAGDVVFRGGFETAVVGCPTH